MHVRLCVWERVRERQRETETETSKERHRETGATVFFFLHLCVCITSVGNGPHSIQTFCKSKQTRFKNNAI